MSKWQDSFDYKFCLGTQDYGNSTITGQPDNGLFKYWLKIVQETWICELSPLNN